ncbi:MAG: lipopolysaccharide transport periplasmic protein LptA [Xanthomonadales bacterium]|nr:lipopolysaccharide transport periplasmic protein LptA [Gammaproteobacteria bacterium]MBT8050535.1 lipopolysaccharide transport periplasmic protein LptA [Gammaproteobacteria bacterium]MBT8056092.1 lipopolysaccharide transport periplasmic protein LptA [Gammaproteobacteria bacterium]NNJ78010.1 lipopolysaccharide transport periplasmic protein LptA [Xanthomonadales bacterium]NNL04372.1 lipopolysaccharide transport periplasmic protein LptA [Xanthomonadales bacterium]
MKCIKRSSAAFLCLLLAAPSVQALKTDRQEPLDVKADATSGTLGDGLATLEGQVEIRQGSLRIQADVAKVSKTEGRVTRIALTGNPVQLQQEIENEGLVVAQASAIEYEVATGIVTLTGEADVVHPQYHISGEALVYDMNVQHFQGSSTDPEGRIQIRLDPELLPGNQPGTTPGAGAESPTEDPGEDPGANPGEDPGTPAGEPG